MPLVFTINESTASGHRYDDRLGSSYEYPTMYRNIIKQGERFVYYRGSRGKSGERVQPVYLGTGVVGAIRQSQHVSDCLVCDVVDFHLFPTPVAFRSADGDTLEPGGAVGGRYYQKGVRTISEDDYAHIVSEAAALAVAPVMASPEYDLNIRATGQIREGAPDTLSQRTRYSMRIEWSNTDHAFIVSVPELPGCATHGATYEEAVVRGQEAIESWLTANRAWGKPIPDPRTLG
ncbi:MAG TPA: type II toxin-antitoxin system HicB family antitoxin [Ktedonobacterales bacterium]